MKISLLHSRKKFKYPETALGVVLETSAEVCSAAAFSAPSFSDGAAVVEAPPSGRLPLKLKVGRRRGLIRKSTSTFHITKQKINKASEDHLGVAAGLLSVTEESAGAAVVVNRDLLPKRERPGTG